ncbi:MAG: hypothetical protein H7839_14290 [Magnetococcus sp. YQC-5]
MFEWIFQLINHPITPWVTAASIPVWGLILWYTLLDQFLRPLRKELSDTLFLLDETPHAPKEFTPSFNQIDAHLNTLPLLSQPWTAFKGTLIHAHTPDQAILSGQRPEAFFNPSLMDEHHYQARLIHTAPTLLAGAGLLFTFLGLVGALYYTSQGLLSDDLNSSQKALQGLLGTAAFKFLSSIAGFLSAALFTQQTRHWHQRLALELESLCRMLSSRLEFITGERLSYDQLHATRQLQAHLRLDIPNNKIHTPTWSLEPLSKTMREESGKLITLIQERLPRPEETAHQLPMLTKTLQNTGEQMLFNQEKMLDKIINKLSEIMDQRQATIGLQDSQLLADISAHLHLAADILEQNNASNQGDGPNASMLADMLRHDGTQMLNASHAALEQMAASMVSLEYSIQNSLQANSDNLANALQTAWQEQASLLSSIIHQVQTLVPVTPAERTQHEITFLRDASQHMAQAAEAMTTLSASMNMETMLEILREEATHWNTANNTANNTALIKALEGMGLASLPLAMERAMQHSTEALEEAIKQESQRFAGEHPEILERLEIGILRHAEERAGAETELLSRIALQLNRAVAALEQKAADGSSTTMDQLLHEMQQHNEQWSESLGDRLAEIQRTSIEDLRGTMEELMHWNLTHRTQSDGSGLSNEGIQALISGLREEGEALATLHRQGLEEVLIGMDAVRSAMSGAFELSTTSLTRALQAEGERVIEARPEILEHLESSILMQAEARADAQSVLLARMTMQLGQAVEALEEQARHGPPVLEMAPLIESFRAEIGHWAALQQEGLERLMTHAQEQQVRQVHDTMALLTSAQQSDAHNALMLPSQQSSNLDRMTLLLERTVMALEELPHGHQIMTQVMDALRTEQETLSQWVQEMRSSPHSGAMETLIEGLRDEGNRMTMANETAMERVVSGLLTVAEKIDHAFDLSSATLTAAVEQESTRLLDARPEILERLEAGILQQAEARMGAECAMLDRIALQLARTTEALEARAVESNTLAMMLDSVRHEGEIWTKVLADRLAQGQQELFARLQESLGRVLTTDHASAPPAPVVTPDLLSELESRTSEGVVAALTPLVQQMHDENTRMISWQQQTLNHLSNVFTTLENRLNEPLNLSSGTIPVSIQNPTQDETTLSLDPTSLEPFLEGLRLEGQALARELGQYMLTMQPKERGLEEIPRVTRSEQDSWMRIIDRMELAAQALEQQAVGLNGLGSLSGDLRQAGYDLIQSGQEALDTVLTSVADFNVKMEGMFANSADALLDRLAQSHQEIITHILQGLGTDRDADVGMFLQGVASQLETAITDNREMQQATAQVLAPVMTGLRQEGERLLEAGDAAMRQTLNAVTQFHQQLEQSLQESIHQLANRLTDNQQELGERLTTALTQALPPPSPPTLMEVSDPDILAAIKHLKEKGGGVWGGREPPPQEMSPEAMPERLPDPLWHEAAQRLEQAARALEAWSQNPPPPVVIPLPPTPAPAPAAPPPASSTNDHEAALEEMLMALKKHFPKLAYLDSNAIIREAIERLNALLGHDDRPCAIEAYPALMALRQEVARILQSEQFEALDPHSVELPKRIAALIQSWEEPLVQQTTVDPAKPAALPVPTVKTMTTPVIAPTRPAPITKPLQPSTDNLTGIQAEPNASNETKETNAPMEPMEPKTSSTPVMPATPQALSTPIAPKHDKIITKTSKTMAGLKIICFKPHETIPSAIPIMHATPTILEVLSEFPTGDKNYAQMVARYLRKRQRPPFYLVKEIWSSVMI